MTLELTPEAMRVFGYRVVDVIVDHMAALDGKRVTGGGDRQTLDDWLGGPPPEDGADPEMVLDTFERDVAPNVMYTNHPRFFAFVPGPSNFVGVMADALAAGFNGVWVWYGKSKSLI